MDNLPIITPTFCHGYHSRFTLAPPNEKRDLLATLYDWFHELKVRPFFEGGFPPTDQIADVLERVCHRSLDTVILNGDRTKFKIGIPIWPDPNKLVLANCSSNLASFLRGDYNGPEIGFAARYIAHSNGTYHIEILEEGKGYDHEVYLPDVIVGTTGFKEEVTIGMGHTHPIGSVVNTFSGPDINEVLGGYGMFRPHLLLTSQHAVLYLPFKGIYLLDKAQIEVKENNPKKRLILALGPAIY